jgi:nucleoside-diphosphate-sugar epimerase
MKQSVLVLGASGFIGSRVIKALSVSDWALPIAASRRALDRGSAGQPRSVRLDARDARQVRRAMDGVAGVVNCVLGSRATIRASARALFEASGSMPQPPRIVHLSSIAVYGAAVGGVQENTTPVGTLSAYGAAKLEAERLAAANPAVVILRPGIVYGPNGSQWSGRIAELLCAHRLGDLGAAGDGYCNLIYIDDVVEAILRALRSPSVGGKIFNLALPNPPTWNEYLTGYAKALGAVPLVRISKRTLQIESKIFAPPQKLTEIVLNKFAPRLTRLVPKAIPPSLIRLFAQEIRLQVELAETELGLSWTPLVEGLRQTAAWYNTSRRSRNSQESSSASG